MKLSTTVLTLLPLTSTAHPGIRSNHAHSEFFIQKPYLQRSRPSLHHEEKRQHIPPSIEQGPAVQFLPPPYDPASTHLKSPCPLSGVSAWDDSGRAQMFDNMPSDMQIWGPCPPEGLDCNRCPRDRRCWICPPPSDSTDYVPPVSSSADEGYEGGVQGGDGEGGICPLRTCKPTHDLSSPWACGRNAKCSKGHCVCATGFKSLEGKSVRGFDDLSKVTVWVDRGVDCDIQCDSLSCKEVAQVDACFQRYENGVVVPVGGSVPSGHVDVLEAGKMGGHGAVQVPGAAE